MNGHPRLLEASIRHELGKLFEFIVFREGVYDMQLMKTDDGCVSIHGAHDRTI